MTPVTRSRRYLPHLEAERPVYFVTFRLADSLPRELLDRLRQERQHIQKATQVGTAGVSDAARLTKLRVIIQRAERCLDGGLGESHMRDLRIAKIVAHAIGHFQGDRYELFAWCVMPNHIHAAFSPVAPHKLGTIVHSWKSFSAHAANRVLARSGRFWQREYFDHLVRDEASLLKIVRYIEDNPRRAGLRNWPWVSGAAMS